MLIAILTTTIIGGVLSLLGGMLLLWKENLAKRFSLVLVAFAVGSLLGAAFLELIPEALAELGSYEEIGAFIVGGILTMFLLERVLHFYHHHDQDDHTPGTVSGISILSADSIHNFIDGVTIALSFGLSNEAGIATAVAVLVHEIPQEVGDFGVLLHLGYARSKVLLYNLFSSLAAVFGGVIGYLFLGTIGNLLPYFLSFAAGSFIYIAVSDLLPELKHREKGGDWAHLLSIAVGVLLVWGMGLVVHE